MPAQLTVAEAMRATPREDYLPEEMRHRADVDAPVTLGHGSTCSQPHDSAHHARAARRP